MIENGSRKKLIVGLCDDEPHIHDIIRPLLEGYAQKNRIEMETVHFYSAAGLLQYEYDLDLLLLDIDMPDMDGIAAAAHLNAREVSYRIIMLTVKTERFKDAFKIGAFRFVTKPVSVEELYEAMDDVRERMVGMETIQVFRGGVSYTLLQRDIDYIMSDRDVTVLFTSDSEYCSEYSLAKWKEELDDRMFFQSHRSYIVNLGRIDRIEKEAAILVSEEKVPISRRNRTALLKAFVIYDTKRR